MTIWLDAHLSPRTAVWIASEFGFEAKPLREIGLRDAEDYAIFQAGKEAGAILLTKTAIFCSCWRGTEARRRFCG